MGREIRWVCSVAVYIERARRQVAGGLKEKHSDVILFFIVIVSTFDVQPLFSGGTGEVLFLPEMGDFTSMCA